MVLPLLRLVRPPDAGATPAAGRLPPLDESISASHWQILLDWSMAFNDEAGLTDPRELIATHLRERLPRGSMAFWLDAHDAPVSLIGATLIAPGGARVGPVYTPPPLRGRGFARAAVTAGCRRLIDQGAGSVFIFTDAANPTSNTLYRRIGFEPIGQHLHLEPVAG
jgi:predicted GNAT family acetyltransferase